MRATPGVLFQGHQRPSTVTGQAADQKQVRVLNKIDQLIFNIRITALMLVCLEQELSRT